MTDLFAPRLRENVVDMTHYKSLLQAAIFSSCTLLAPPLPGLAQTDFGLSVSEAAIERTRHQVAYDPSYVRLTYPMGDVASDRGVCTDVVIRAYRKLGIDLQERVHDDMSSAFEQYPKIWGLRRADPNIDHRRVPNLQRYFERNGESLGPSNHARRFKPGDIVTWTVGGNRPHIGIVVERRSKDGERPLVVHNIGAGPKLEDVLFSYPMTGHYRYTG